MSTKLSLNIIYLNLCKYYGGLTWATQYSNTFNLNSGIFKNIKRKKKIEIIQTNSLLLFIFIIVFILHIVVKSNQIKSNRRSFFL